MHLFSLGCYDYPQSNHSDLLIRYSTGLDNELFKAIAALRAEQEFRNKNATA